jgi:hypothetical protein
VTAEPLPEYHQKGKDNTAMTTTTESHTRAGEEIVLLIRVGSERHGLTAFEVRDTVAAYLSKGGHMPTPRDGDGTDPCAPLHVITDEWLWGNVTGWAASADVVQLANCRHRALTWIRDYFGAGFPDLDH